MHNRLSVVDEGLERIIHHFNYVFVRLNFIGAMI
jgi:hypothetical protein